MKTFEHLIQLMLTHRHLKLFLFYACFFFHFVLQKTSIKKFPLQKYKNQFWSIFSVILLHVCMFLFFRVVTRCDVNIIVLYVFIPSMMMQWKKIPKRKKHLPGKSGITIMRNLIYFCRFSSSRRVFKYMH